MKLTLALLKSKGRQPGKPPYSFRQVYPFELKDEVSGKSDPSPGVACLEEMATMFACFRLHDFSQSQCDKEIQLFTECAKKDKLQRVKAKQLRISGEGIVGAKRLPSEQLNILLAKFPQPK